MDAIIGSELDKIDNNLHKIFKLKNIAKYLLYKILFDINDLYRVSHCHKLT